ncbi:hypothetical protein SGRIM128S_02067 [Streptomyces griseomycini]
MCDVLALCQLQVVGRRRLVPVVFFAGHGGDGGRSAADTGAVPCTGCPPPAARLEPPGPRPPRDRAGRGRGGRMGEGDQAPGGRTVAALDSRLAPEDEAGFSMTPPTTRTRSRRGHAPVIRLRGRSRRRPSVAALVCYKAGEPSRLTWALPRCPARRTQKRLLEGLPRPRPDRPPAARRPDRAGPGRPRHPPHRRPTNQLDRSRAVTDSPLASPGAPPTHVGAARRGPKARPGRSTAPVRAASTTSSPTARASRSRSR